MQQLTEEVVMEKCMQSIWPGGDEDAKTESFRLSQKMKGIPWGETEVETQSQEGYKAMTDGQL